MDIIERAARALEDSDVTDPHERRMNDYDAMARAVLMAIREPNEAMVEKGADAFTNVRDIWQAMIDEALYIPQ